MVVKQHVPVVHGRVAILRADVAHGYAWERLVSLCVPNLQQECLRAVRSVGGRVVFGRQTQLCDNNLSW